MFSPNLALELYEFFLGGVKPLRIHKNQLKENLAEESSYPGLTSIFTCLSFS